ncbi:MAG: hypothetical protein MK165_13350 [Pirellulaceae bacterium]|nr:hypothetical protein [Pirellulaceae bacterium]
MEEIKRQVANAQRRLILNQFLRIFSWCLFTALLVATCAVAVPKLWVLQITADADHVALWNSSWIGGMTAVGLILAMVSTYLVRRSSIDAAIELDRRFGLKERISSTLTLAPAEVDSDTGQALVNDASRRVARVEVKDEFGINVHWRNLLPLLPALMIFALIMFVGNAEEPAKASQNTPDKIKQQVKNALDHAKPKLEQRRKRIAEKNLEDLEAMIKDMERHFDELSNDANINRKKVAMRINDLAKKLNDRRKQLGDPDEIRKQLDQLKKLQQGPAQKLGKAMRAGDFDKALSELKQLQEKLKNGGLNETEKKQLGDQLKQMQEKMQAMADAHKQAKKELEQMIQEKQRSGETAAAGDLQKKLDKMNRLNDQMNQLKQMASSMGKAAEQMKKGELQGAQKQLAEMADQMQNMQNAVEEMETLDDLMDQIADAKDAMNCESCQGSGCKMCQGDGFGQQALSNNLSNGGGSQTGKPGFGLGEGRGQGDRPKEKTESGEYRSKVGAKPKKGEAIRVGDADGPNASGTSKARIQDAIESALKEESDPLINTRLPRQERKHAEQYLEKFRQGE